MTGSVGLILVLIGMIAGIGIVLWLFTHDREWQFGGYIDTAKKEDLVDYKECSGPVLPPDDIIINHHIMHRDRY
jgi:hypothetical protein